MVSNRPKRARPEDEDEQSVETDTLSTEALAKLQSKDERRLLDVVDKLRRTGLHGTIELPQLVVCGDQSSGKSSLLEAITEIPFPRKANLCTRFGTEIVLRREGKTTVTVKIVPGRNRSDADKKKLSAFTRALLDVRHLPDVIDAATQEMGLGKIGVTRAFTRDILSITICGPDRPQLTLVDLPGLIQAPTKQATQADKELIHELVREYMVNPRTIILAVVSARNDAANQCILSMFKEIDQKGSRTLGIITKPDCITSEDQQQWFDLVQNKEVFLERGWHMIKNPSSGQRTAKQRNDEEEAFFNQGPFKELPRDMVGIETLCRRLSKLLLCHLTQELPSLKQEMQAKLDDTNAQLLKLGDKRDTPAEQRVVLMKIAMKINHIVSSAVNGHYLHEFFEAVDLDSSVDSGLNIRRFRAVIQKLNHEFAELMLSRGHAFNFESEEDRDRAKETAPGVQTDSTQANNSAKTNGKSNKTADGKAEKDSQKNKKQKNKSDRTNPTDGLPSPQHLSYDDTIEWVKDTITHCRGHELPGSVNPDVTSHLFWKQSSPWRFFAAAHIERVRAACAEFVRQLLEYAAPTEFKKPLEDLVITAALEETHQDANEEFYKLLDDHARHPSTYDHCYSSTLQKKRNKKYVALTAAARREATTPYPSTIPHPSPTTPSPHPQPQPQLPSHFDADVFQQAMARAVSHNAMTFAAEEALESQSAYYADELKYFVRAVTKQVVERCLVVPLPARVLSPMVVAGLSEAEVEFIAGESVEVRAQRAWLEERRALLEERRALLEERRALLEERRALLEERRALLEKGFEVFREVGGAKGKRARRV